MLRRRGGGRILRHSVQRHPLDLAPTKEIDAQVLGDLEKPGGELSLALEAREPPSHPKEDLLRQILRLGRVPDDPFQVSLDRPVVGTDERIQRLLLTLGGLADHFGGRLLHLGPLSLLNYLTLQDTGS
jgi:hypothetical protein